MLPGLELFYGHRPFPGGDLRSGALLALGDQLLEQGQAAYNHVVVHAVADAEILRAAEIPAGHQQQILLFGKLGELVAVAVGGFDEQIERAVGLCHGIAHSGQLRI